MAFYKKQFSERQGVYYPQAIVIGKPVETEEVVKELAEMSSLTPGDAYLLLANLPGVLAKFMKQGKSVRIKGLGTFRYSLETHGVENEADFDFQSQVERVLVQFTPETTFAVRGSQAQRALVSNDIEWIDIASLGLSPADDTTDEPTTGEDEERPGGL